MNKYIRYIIESFFDDIEDDILNQDEVVDNLDKLYVTDMKRCKTIPDLVTSICDKLHLKELIDIIYKYQLPTDDFSVYENVFDDYKRVISTEQNYHISFELDEYKKPTINYETNDKSLNYDFYILFLKEHSDKKVATVYIYDKNIVLSSIDIEKSNSKESVYKSFVDMLELKLDFSVNQMNYKLYESFFDDIEDDIISDNTDAIDSQISINAISKLSKYTDETKYQENIDNISFNKYELYTKLVNDLVDMYIVNSYNVNTKDISYNISLNDENNNGYDVITISTDNNRKYYSYYIYVWIHNNIIKYIYFPKIFYMYDSTAISLNAYYELATLLHDKYNMSIENILTSSILKVANTNRLNIKLQMTSSNFYINPEVYNSFPHIYTLWDALIEDKELSLNNAIKYFNEDTPIKECELIPTNEKFEENDTNIITICNTLKKNKICKNIIFKSFNDKIIPNTPGYNAFLKWSYDNKNYIYSVSNKQSLINLKHYLIQRIMHEYIIPTDGQYNYWMYSFDFTKGQDADKRKYVDVKLDFDGDLADSDKHMYHTITFKFYLTGGDLIDFNDR